MIFGWLVFLELVGISLQACSTQTSTSKDPWSVQLLDTSIVINNTFTTNIKGSSADGKYYIQISNNQGQVSQSSKKTAVVVNAGIPWGNLTLYGIIGADSSGILMGWAYCSPDKRLTALWLEDTSGQAGFTKSSVTGTCNVSSISQETNYHIPGECVEIDPPQAHPTIQGSDISLQPQGVGSVNLKQEYNLLPFEIVNCLNCGNSSSNGWIEVHSVLSSKTSSNVCIGIFYLYAQQRPSPMVLLAYLNCFQEQETDFQWLSANYDISGHSLQMSTPDNTSQMPNPTTQMPAASTTPNPPTSGSSMLQPVTTTTIVALLIITLLYTLPFS